MRLYEAADARNAPPRNAILLVGDSQFCRWKTVAEDLLGDTVINRGDPWIPDVGPVLFCQSVASALRGAIDSAAMTT